MAAITVYACGDLHDGPECGALDATPGFDEEWAKVPAPKIRLGDMVDHLQFPSYIDHRKPSTVADYRVRGNHDARCGCPLVRVVGDTAFFHGHALPSPRMARRGGNADIFLDPWLYRKLGPVLTWLIGKAELVWPNIDERLSGALSMLGGGRWGQFAHYAQGVAEWLECAGLRQGVMGHLHGHPRSILIRNVTVTCVGCWVNGRRDIVPIEVNI